MRTFEICEVELAQDLSKIEIDQQCQKKYDQIYEARQKYLCSYSWMKESDKYMIGTNSDEITKKTLDDMYAKRAQAKSWIISLAFAKTAPILIPIFWMIFK